MIDKKAQDADLAHSAEALKRAAERAKQTAERTNTPFVVYKNGKIEKRMRKKGGAAGAHEYR